MLNTTTKQYLVALTAHYDDRDHPLRSIATSVMAARWVRLVHLRIGAWRQARCWPSP